MRITVLGALGPGQLADSLAYGLTALGHDVASVSDQPLVPATPLGRLIARRRSELMRFSPNWPRQLELAEAVVSTRPDLLLAVKTPYLQGRTIERIRHQSRARIFNWYPDNPFVDYGQRAPFSSLRRYDRIIVFSPALAERVRTSLKVEAQYIPFGFDPRYYFPTPEPRTIKADVAFVGQYRPERGALVSALLEAGFSMRVAGPGWETTAMPVQSAWQPGPTWGADAGRVYHEARVGLNDLHAKSNAHSHNMRSWEIPATGTPMATSESAHQRELLAGIPSVAYYTGPRDLAATVDRLIATSFEPIGTADLSAHTYKERCRSLLRNL